MSESRETKNELIDVCYKVFGSHSFSAGFFGSMVESMMEDLTPYRKAVYMRMMQSTIEKYKAELEKKNVQNV